MKNYFLYSFISISFIFFSNCKAIDIMEIIDNNNIIELNKIIKNGFDVLNIVNYLEITTYEYVISLNNFRINEIISNYR